MELIKSDIENLFSKLNWIEDQDSFIITIPKVNHSFKIQALKNGQFIYVSLFRDSDEYLIEHFEFYMHETKKEILNELNVQVNTLASNETRTSIQRKWFSDKVKAQIFVEGEWINYGYLASVEKVPAPNKEYK